MSGDGVDAKVAGEYLSKLAMVAPLTIDNYNELEDEDFEYNMRHGNRGIAVIINNDKFNSNLDMGDRPGSSVDREELVKALEFIKFKDIMVKNNQTVQQMKDLMIEVSGRDFTDKDCLFVAILSHGDESSLYGVDGPVTYEELFSPVKSERAHTLVGKPKIVLVQACRGQTLDEGKLLQADAGPTEYNRPKRYHISKESDFLVAYSTVQGYYAWRNGIKGSWFVQSFCEVILRDGRRLEMHQLLVRVNRMVSYTFKSNHPHPDFNSKKQSPCITSTLTRSLFFG